MARRNRESRACADVIGDHEDARARLVIRLDAIVGPDGSPVGRRAAARWLPPVRSGSAALDERPGASIVLDATTYELHLGDSGGSQEGLHPGHDFVAPAIRHGVDVYVIDLDRIGGDIRRLGSVDLDDVAARGALLGGLVRAYEVAVR